MVCVKKSFVDHPWWYICIVTLVLALFDHLVRCSPTAQCARERDKNQSPATPRLCGGSLCIRTFCFVSCSCRIATIEALQKWIDTICQRSRKKKNQTRSSTRAPESCVCTEWQSAKINGMFTALLLVTMMRRRYVLRDGWFFWTLIICWLLIWCPCPIPIIFMPEKRDSSQIGRFEW